MSAPSKALRITEIFHSLQGESITSGVPTVFIRLTGCPLRCQYCDTAYAFHGGAKLNLETILERVATFDCKHVCVTGGEPLAQPDCIPLLQALCNQDHSVSLETSGALDIAHVDPRVTIVMDLKAPGSNETNKNKWSNLNHLKQTDQIKFVICNREDYDWACNIISEHDLTTRSQVLLSPSWGELNPTLLANWIVEDRLRVRFQLQLHKILWGDKPGH